MRVGRGWGVVGAVMAMLACADTALARVERVATAAAKPSAKPSAKLSERRAYPGQVIVAKVRGVAVKRARVTVGGKRAKVLSRRRARLTFAVPKVKPGKARVVIAVGRRRLRGSLTIVRPVGAAKLKVTADGARTASGVVGPQGVVVAAAGADGTTFELSVPPGAAPPGTTISLTPVSKLAGAPVSDRSPFGVVFGPDGLRFSRPATLTIRPAKAKRRVLAFAFGADGRRTGFLRRAGGSGALGFEVRHFSGAGGGAASEADLIAELAAFLARAPSSDAEVLDAARLIRTGLEEYGPRWCSNEPTCVAVRDVTRAHTTRKAARCAGHAAGLTTLGPVLDELAFWRAMMATDELDPRTGAGPQVDGSCMTQVMGAGTRMTRGPRPLPSIDEREDEGMDPSPECSDASQDLDGDGQTVVIECAILARILVEVVATELVHLAPADQEAVRRAEFDMRRFLHSAMRLAAFEVNTDYCDVGRFDEGRARLEKVRAMHGLVLRDFPADPHEVPGVVRDYLDGCPKITVTPANARIDPDRLITFSATSEDPSDAHFTFSSSDNRISPTSGEYRAPEQTGSVDITATSSEHPDRKGRTSLTIGCPSGGQRAAQQCEEIAITISPDTANLSPGETRQFTATVTGSTDTGVTWSADSGSITSGGLYTAPGTYGYDVVRVKANADPSKTALAVITVDGTVEIVSRRSQAAVAVQHTGGGENSAGDEFYEVGDWSFSEVVSNSCGASASTSGTQTAGLVDGQLLASASGQLSTTGSDQCIAFAVSSLVVEFTVSGGPVAFRCEGEFPASSGQTTLTDYVHLSGTGISGNYVCTAGSPSTAFGLQPGTYTVGIGVQHDVPRDSETGAVEEYAIQATAG